MDEIFKEAIAVEQKIKEEKITKFKGIHLQILSERTKKWFK